MIDVTHKSHFIPKMLKLGQNWVQPWGLHKNGFSLTRRVDHHFMGPWVRVSFRIGVPDWGWGAGGGMASQGHRGVCPSGLVGSKLISTLDYSSITQVHRLLRPAATMFIDITKIFILDFQFYLRMHVHVNISITLSQQYCCIFPSFLMTFFVCYRSMGWCHHSAQFIISVECDCRLNGTYLTRWRQKALLVMNMPDLDVIFLSQRLWLAEL